MTLCCKTWEIQNREVRGVVENLPADIVAWSQNYLDAYQEVQIQPSPASTDFLPQTRIPTNPPYIKVNVDVALPENEEFYQVCMVARIHEGTTIWWSSKEFSGRPNPSDGKAITVLHGVKVAASHAWRWVIFETDCLPVYRYLVSHCSSLVSFGAVLDTCLDYISCIILFVVQK